MVIGAAEMDITTLGVASFAYSPSSPRSDGSIEVSNWTFSEDTEKSQPSFVRSIEMVNYFATKIGPYPYEKLANVQSSTRFGGMENASAIFYSQEAIAKGRNIESTVSHEIAHQWFGDSVTEKEWYHLWLSEGFATYFGALFFEQSVGRDDFIDRMKKSKNRIFQSKVTDRPIVDYEVRDLFKLLNSNNYPKGAWVLHMLRGLLGDEIFFKGISKYYSKYYKIPSIGIRFFTCYGPWGRPDMSLFLFTKAILNNKPLMIFNKGNMFRDFTYIDDIVEGVYRILQEVPQPDPNWSGDNSNPATSSAPHRLYNIGSNLHFHYFLSLIHI